MATNHTTNYQLNLWEPTDRFLREEFNENSQKIDAALKAEADARAALTQTVAQKADASTLNALTQTVNTKADAAAMNAALAQKADTAAVNTALAKKGVCRFETGTYTGSGQYGSSNPNTLTFTGKPMMVFVGWQMRMFRGFNSSYSHVTRSSLSVSWGERSVQWHSSYSVDAQCSASGTKYWYFALISTEE